MDKLRTGSFRKAILWGIILIALLSGLVTLAQRHRVEAENTSIEVIMDYVQLKEFSDSIGIPPLIVLQKLQEAGLTSVAITEETIEDLLEKNTVTAMTGKELLNMQKIAGRSFVPQEKIDPAYIYLLPEKGEAEQLYDRLSRRLGSSNVTLYNEGENQVLQISRSGEKLNKRGIGFDFELIKAVSDLGLYLVARPYNFPGITGEVIEQTFRELEQVSKLSTVVFAGDEIYGYPKEMEVTAEVFKRLGRNYGAAETPVQRGFMPARGLDEMFRLMDYQVLRVYSATVSEIRNPTMLNLVDNAVRSVKERNIRALYLKPINSNQDAAPEEQLKENIDYVRMIKGELESQGYTVAVGKPFASFWTNRYLTAFVVAGVVAAAFLTLNLFYPLPLIVEVVFIILAWIGAAVLLPSSYGTLFRQGTAALTAVFFPTIAVVPFLRPGKREYGFKNSLVLATVSFLRAVVISLIGGLFVGALLGDVPFLIEYFYFRGVKLVHLLPLLLLVLVYLRNRGRNLIKESKPVDRIRQIYIGAKEFLSKKVYIGHLVLLSFVAVAGYIYIGRTGHTAGIPVPNLEVQLRALLDKLLYIRPRTKEFLIGHPGIILAAYLGARGYHRYTPLIVIGSVIGQISLVNSFAHLRTPVLLSFLRTLNGVWLGLIIGLVGCVLAEIMIKIIKGLRGNIDD
jgi:hypothetical protein